MASEGELVVADREAATAFRDAAAARNIRIIYLGGLGDPDEAAGRSRACGAGARSSILRGPPTARSAAPAGPADTRPAAPHRRRRRRRPGRTSRSGRHRPGRTSQPGRRYRPGRHGRAVCRHRDGAGSASFEILRSARQPTAGHGLPALGDDTVPADQVGSDVVRYLIAALDLAPGSYDIGGPDVLSYEQMMRRYAAITGRTRLIIKVPILSPGLSSHWIGLVTDQPASVARPLADGLW